MTLYDQIKSMPKEDQARIIKMIAAELDELDRNAIELLRE